MILEEYRIRTGWLANKLVRFVDWFTKDYDEYGFAFWPFIFFEKTEDNTPYHRAHEKKHIEQWVRYWLFGFLPLYLYQWLKYGYWNMPLEVEARQASKDLTRKEV